MEKVMSVRFSRTLLAVFIFLLLALSLQAQPARDTSTVYIHPLAPSFNIRILKCAAKLFLPKHSIEKKLDKKHFVSEAAAIPKQLFSDFTIDITQICGRNVYTISPKGKASGKYILFLHGGAYINNIFRQHWKFAAAIIRLTQCTFVIPDYPLAPSSGSDEAFTMLYVLYSELLSRVKSTDIILMGDSAGGGLTLALAEKQKKNGIPLAGQIILLCPWLDVSMTNTAINEIQKKDVALRASSLVVAGKAWAGSTGTDNYLVSPINGSLQGLPPISLFIGTHDILWADCRKLKTIMDQKGVALNYFEYPGLFHDWMMLTSLKESKIAISQIVSLILDSPPEHI